MKKRFGDRKDGKLMRDLDSMHNLMAIMYPNRCDNEAFFEFTLDLTNTDLFLQLKNDGSDDYKYNIFQVIVAAMLKTIYLRPKMNRFIKNENFYQRNDISAAFTIKKQFHDNGGEGLITLKAGPDWTFETVHQELKKRVFESRNSDVANSTEQEMEAFNKLPRWIFKRAVHFVMWLDKHGWMPESMTNDDIFQSSVVLSNLGSLKLDAGYHHLTNWGTTSVFCVIGLKKPRPFTNDDGTVEMRDSINLGVTLDERIADGYYFAKTLRLIKTLIENPSLLDLPFEKEVEING